MRKYVTHGMCYSPEYSSWNSMRCRCNNPNRKDYARYGGRGIKVCPQWDDFRVFYADVGPRPSLQHSLERINHKGNYEPGNVRWATSIEQANNTGQSTVVDYLGNAMTIAQAMRASGCTLNRSTVYERIQKGWPIKEAFEYPAVSQQEIPIPQLW